MDAEASLGTFNLWFPHLWELDFEIKPQLHKAAGKEREGGV